MAVEKLRETDLYPPVHDYLVAQGYTVRSEVNGCDITAVKEEDLIVIELKRGFSTDLLIQATQRQKIADSVYVAIPKPSAKGKLDHWRGVRHLLRRLEIGLLFVTLAKEHSSVEIVFHPLPFERKRNSKNRRAILREIAGRSGDYNQGGCTRTKLCTAYREQALFIACCLEKHGALAPRQLRSLGAGTKTQSILASNYYGWFERVERGIYALRPQGEAALNEYPLLTALPAELRPRGI
ncbi:MAG TPA: DUF2161 family putative PD-(D/E)XK-type phosphodiesterase, partial [Armatimonadota bacterium]|nr:DUF2161 family putative PD-(D/E)XK-type phosphodiesterase [Armatimonadota bacterium]